MKCFSTRLVLFAIAAVLILASAGVSQGPGDVRRHTLAVTYLRDPITVRFAGTTLRPDARGEATVERWRKRNETEIDVTIENLIPAFNYGADYTTYVLWAITPGGQVANLGEFRLTNGAGRLKAATAFQTFAMIITAEPHFMVRLPSPKVILENLAPSSKNIRIQVSEVNFTGDSGKYYTDKSVPAIAERDYNRIPMELLQARRAIQIARIADGERYSPADFNNAVQFLQQAESAHQRGASVHEVGRISREAISLAVRARDTAEERAEASMRRAEIARRDDEVRRANENASDLEGQLQETQARLRASELARNNTESELGKALRESADARAEVRSLKAENGRLRSDLDQANRQLDDARAEIRRLESQYSSASARLDETSSRVAAMETAEKTRRELEDRRRNFAELRDTLSRVVTVKPTASGFVAIIPDSFFLPNKPDLSLKSKSKVDAVVKALNDHSSAAFFIEGHSDARPSAESFALGRANAIAAYLEGWGIARTRFTVNTMGASAPVAKGKTVKARVANRRVELVFENPR